MPAKTRFRRVAFVLLPFAAACSDSASPTSSATDLAEQLPRAVASSASVQDEYIVTFDDTETDPVGRARALVAQQNGQLRQSYRHALKGFAANLTPQAAAALARTPGVRRVEPDVAMQISETVTPTSWGLDRLDQRLLPLSGSYTFNSIGAGVRVYIVDTGIRTSHSDFGGRAIGGFTAIGDGNGTNDCHGHGTHVAGTVGGSTAGVARGVQLVAVRVLDCSGSGSSSGVIAGIDYITGQKNGSSGTPMVANMSLGGSYSASLNDAVTRSVAAGVVFAVAAGNSNVDACSQSPAASPNAITVGASDRNDLRASYSNFGTCVDLFAPGSAIVSAYVSSDYAFATMSGTSMASPHVAGVAALILGDSPSSSPEQVRATMLSGATSDVLQSVGSGSPNVLLSTLYGSVEGPAPTPPPVPSDPTAISLSVTKSRSGKNSNANLSWSGATAAMVDVYRNGSLRTTTANDGAHTDSKLPAGSYTYTVCQARTCSPSVTVTF